MKKTRYTEEQIAFALKQAETSTPAAKVLRRMGFRSKRLTIKGQDASTAEYGTRSLQQIEKVGAVPQQRLAIMASGSIVPEKLGFDCLEAGTATSRRGYLHLCLTSQALLPRERVRP